jgi:hypothetical protein
MSVRHVLLVLAFLTCSVAHSQPPAPSPAKGGTDPQAQTSQRKQAAAADQRGTPKAPLVVQIVPTPKTQAEAAQESENREAKATSDQLMLAFTGVLALFTVILAISTIALYKVTGKAATAAKQSADAAAAQFVATHRPRLIVRRIYFRDASTIAYEVANIGGIEATIQGVKAAVVTGALPRGNPDVGEPYRLAPTTIHAGSKHEFTHPFPDEIRFDKGFGGEEVVWTVKPDILILGNIAYSDRLGISRRTAFCRRYDFKGERFVPTEQPDPDYEHAD